MKNKLLISLIALSLFLPPAIAKADAVSIISKSLALRKQDTGIVPVSYVLSQNATTQTTQGYAEILLEPLNEPAESPLVVHPADAMEWAETFYPTEFIQLKYTFK